MIRSIFTALCLLICGSVSLSSLSQPTSLLWGKHGELWDPAGRLPDFSFAGYASGYEDLPVSLNGRVLASDYGARPDDGQDDTEALRAAIAAASERPLDRGRVVQLASGRYELRDVLTINASGVVLRGVGEDRTEIYCPVSLEEIKPNPSFNKGGRPTSGYSWSGGLLRIQGQLNRTILTPINEPAARGDKTFQVVNPEGLQNGQWVSIQQHDDSDRTLAEYLYQGDTGSIGNIGTVSTRLAARIVSVRGNQVEIDRPLRSDLRPQWSAMGLQL